jgi:hypothetical protein
LIEPEDLLLIHQLLGLYSHLASERAYERFGDVFVEDAVFDASGLRNGPWSVDDPSWVFVGLEAITAAYRANPEPARTVLTTNSYVFESAGAVRITSKFLAPFADHWRGGVYDDTVVKGHDGLWRFARRVARDPWRCPAMSPVPE